MTTTIYLFEDCAYMSGSLGFLAYWLEVECARLERNRLFACEQRLAAWKRKAWLDDGECYW